MPRYAVGIDLGGTFIKAGVVDEEGRVTGRTRVETNVAGGRDEVVGRIARAAGEAQANAGVPTEQITGVGLGSPGIFNLAEGVVLVVPNLKCLEGEPLRALVAERLKPRDWSVCLENDANAAAWGEKWAGVGRSVSNLVLFTLGTGIGGGIVLDDRLWHGARDLAAELGHQTIEAEGRLCACGNHGCLEQYGSVTGLVRSLREAVESGQPCSLAQALAEGKPVTGEDIHKAAVAGDAAAREAIERTGRYLGIGATNMMHILNPEMIVFVGGLTGAGDMLLNPIRQEARRRTFPPSFEGVQIVFGELGNDAGLIGAAGLALQGED